MNKESIIEDTRSYIDEFEKGTKLQHIGAWFGVVFGIICILLLFFSYQKATELETHNQVINEKIADEKIRKLFTTIVDAKIKLLKIELKLTSNTFGLIGGALLGIGIGQIFNRRQRIKQANVMRGLLGLVEKNF